MVLTHSDFRGINFTSLNSRIAEPNFKELLLDFAFENLSLAAGSDDLVLPAFNYDFTSTRRFDVAEDPPQVGRLPVAAMSRDGWRRNHTPVYSYLSNQHQLETDLNPFSESSFFAGLVKERGTILLLGVGFERFTFMHHVEHIAQIPYRYNKTFHGVRTVDGIEEPCEVTFHVRPMGTPVDYDFNKIQSILQAANVVQEVSAKALLVDAARAAEVILEQLYKDPLIMLTADSRSAVEIKLEEIGKPFEIGDFE
jgi:aminoglycoside N3'-acetyltransferase